LWLLWLLGCRGDCSDYYYCGDYSNIGILVIMVIMIIVEIAVIMVIVVIMVIMFIEESM
jgi:hypothetical protein